MSDKPLMTYRIGTPLSNHCMLVESLRNALDHIMDTFEPSVDAPEPKVTFPGGFWITYSTREEQVRL